MQHRSFTVNWQGKVHEILTEVHVSLPIGDVVVQRGDSRIVQTTALWDTGATNSVITPETVNKLGLKPISTAMVNHAGGCTMSNVYLIDIYLPNNVKLNGVRVTECNEAAGSFGVIIGMDIITLGDFAITNVDGLTTVSFRMPSFERVDYVLQTKAEPTKADDKTGRNALCPCGSGKKYKHCHGKITKAPSMSS